MATKRQRGNTWEFIVRRAGLLPKPISLTFDSEKEGDEYCRRLEAQLDRGVVPKDLRDRFERVRTGDLRAAVGRYKSAQHISKDDAKLLPVILERLPADLKLDRLTFNWASEWVTSMKREQNLSPSTIRHHVGALARALDWLAAEGELPMNPLRLLKKGYSTYTPDDAKAVKKSGGEAKESIERDRRLEEGEEDAIRLILDGQKPENRQRPLAQTHTESLKLMFDMALETAMRMREMYTLSHDQVDLQRRTIFLEKTKNGHKRQVPISKPLAKLLQKYKGNFNGNLFPWWDGSLDEKVLDQTTAKLSRQYARIFDAAKCTDLRFHDLRHEATSRIYERTTLSDLEVMSITGHRSMTMLKRYANLRASTLATKLW